MSDNEEGFNTPQQTPPGTPETPPTPLGNQGGNHPLMGQVQQGNQQGQNLFGAIQVTPPGTPGQPGHPLMGNQPVGNNMGNPMNGNNLFNPFQPPMGMVFGDPFGEEFAEMGAPLLGEIIPPPLIIDNQALQNILNPPQVPQVVPPEEFVFETPPPGSPPEMNVVTPENPEDE
jgi:hypothetical protein